MAVASARRLRTIGAASSTVRVSARPRLYAEECLGLLRSLRQLGCVFGLECNQPADRDRHHEEQQQIEPLVGVADGEGVERFDEQEVVGEEADDGGRNRRDRPWRMPTARTARR